MYRTAFDREIGTPPPSTIDVDRVIRRRRRLRRLRTALTGTAAGVTAVAIVGVTVTSLNGGDPGGGEMFGGPADSGPSASQPASPSVSPSVSPSGSPSPDPVAVRLEGVLRGFLDAKLPGAGYRPNRPASSPHVAPLQFEHRSREAENDGVTTMDAEDYYFATADIVEPAGTGNIGVSVGLKKPGGLDVSATCPADRPLDAKAYTCTPSTGAAGETVMVEQTTGTRAIHYRVVVVRPSGVAVSLWVTNNSRVGAQGEVELDRRDAPEPPLTVGEARELALLSTLTV